MQQPGPTVYVMVDKENKAKENKFAKKTAKGLSIAQITLGATSIFSQILIIILSSIYPSRSYYSYENICGIGEGIYCGVFFVIAGSLGLLASRKASNCNISAFLTLSIIAAVFGALQVSLASVNLIGATGADYAAGPKIGLFSAMIISGFAEFVVAIISSAFCCRGCCCTGGPTSGQVVYLSQGEVEGAPTQSLEGAQIPVPMAYLPRTLPVIGALGQEQSELPSYGDVVHEELEVKETQQTKSGRYERF